MAIGLGLIFGFHFKENFNYPYTAHSVKDIWHRGHISLSTWFRDYIYIPMGGNRVTKSRWVWNLFIVWLLTGIWHGANWTFFVWGLYYFVFLLAEKLLGYANKPTRFSHIYTLFVVLVSWVIFRSLSLSDAAKYIGIMFGIGSKGFFDDVFLYYLSGGKWVLIAAVFFSMPVTIAFRRLVSGVPDSSSFVDHQQSSTAIFALEILQAIPFLIVFVLSVLVCINSTYNPFIYFNF